MLRQVVLWLHLWQASQDRCLLQGLLQCRLVAPQCRGGRRELLPALRILAFQLRVAVLKAIELPLKLLHLQPQGIGGSVVQRSLLLQLLLHLPKLSVESDVICHVTYQRINNHFHYVSVLRYEVITCDGLVLVLLQPQAPQLLRLQGLVRGSAPQLLLLKPLLAEGLHKVLFGQLLGANRISLRL